MKIFRLIALILAFSMLLSCFIIVAPAAGGNVIRGDVNGDGAVDTRDITHLRRYFAAYDYDTGKSELELSAGADMNGDGNISSVDLALLRQYLVNADMESKAYVDDVEDMDSVLREAVIFKVGSEYAYVRGYRINMGENVVLFDGKMHYPADFVAEYGLGVVKESEAIMIDGVKYTTASAFAHKGKMVYLSVGGDYTVITDYNWIYTGSDSEGFYNELDRSINNYFSVGVTLSAKMKGNRPVIFETDEMLAESKINATLRYEPWLTSWQNVLKKANQSLTVDPAPYLGKSATQYRLAACNDFINARSLALAYYNTRDEKYLTRAVEYLMAYADSDILPGTDDHLDYSAATTDGKADLGLNIAVPLANACDTYSLLYPYLTEEEKACIESWISIEVEMVKKGHDYWINNNYYSGQIGNNHLSSHNFGLICAAYVLEDDELLQYAVCSASNDSNYFEMLDRAILMSGDKTDNSDPSKEFIEGEIYDRYRIVSEPSNGFGYAMYHMKFLTYSSLVAHNNGVDLFSYVGTNGENLLLSYKVYADYLIEYDTLIKGGYYDNNSLDEENSYTLYLVADYLFDDEVLREVTAALNSRGVVPGDKEQFGRSGGYIFGKK